MIKEYYSPAEITFQEEHIIWLLGNASILHAGLWPPDPSVADQDRRLLARGPFCTAIEYIVEVERRLENCGTDGLMVLLFYEYDWPVETLANYFRLSTKAIENRISVITWHISGWNYIAKYYRRFDMCRAYDKAHADNVPGQTT